MKKILLGLLIFVGFYLNAQSSIYKGLLYGMNSKEAKSEFKLNKNDYKGIEIGNNFTYNIYSQNFTYDHDKLVSILLTPTGSTFGQSYDDAVNYLTYTKTFLGDLGYEVFIEPEWWSSPQTFNSTNSKYGLVAFNKDKTIIIQLYSMSYILYGTTKYLVKLHIYKYDWWMNAYNKENDKQSTIKNKSGF